MSQKQAKTACSYLTVHIPKNAPDLKALTAGNELLLDSIRLVFHQMYRQLMKLWESGVEGKRQIRSGAWVSLCSEILGQLLGKNFYREVLDFMLEHKLIVQRMNGAGLKTFYPGRCLQFRVPRQHFAALQRGSLYKTESITNAALIKRVMKHLEKKRQEATEELNLKENKSLAKWIKMTQDLKPVAKLVEAQKALATSEEEMELIEHFAETHSDVGLDAFSVDDFGKRRYSHVTNLPSEYRSMYRFNGFENSPHVNIDIQNSQPFFAGMLMKNPKCIRTVIPEFMPISDLLQKHSDKPDTELFFDSVRNGDFYELISEKANLTLERSEIKQRCFKAIFYGKNRIYRGTENYTELLLVRNAFLDLFPHVFEMIQAIKRVDLVFMDDFYYSRKTGERLHKGAYKNLSCAMQRIESKMVWRVNDRLLKHLTIPFTNIHDSWWTPESNESEIRKQVEIVFRRFGVEPPQLKTTIL
ncbi:MAG: hypothetical protein H6601_06785 [Flavobacteriales bacterium]|nr:hypothetical protein [Flavobacteriales bacterium]